jgi:hypothetical protein
MLIKVKTLTGKEIEIDIEPTDKVERIKVRLVFDCAWSLTASVLGARGGEGRHPATTAAPHLLWEADERRENRFRLQGDYQGHIPSPFLI